MNEQNWLSLGRLPGRFTAQQVAFELNLQEAHVPILVKLGLLKPLGHPKPNSIKYFAREEILRLSQDQKWLAKVTDALSQVWEIRNSQRLKNPPKRAATPQRPAPGTMIHLFGKPNDLSTAANQ